ncbi:hypothetical protein ACLOJK_017728 [Asimina triloba]
MGSIEGSIGGEATERRLANLLIVPSAIGALIAVMKGALIVGVAKEAVDRMVATEMKRMLGVTVVKGKTEDEGATKDSN